METAEVKYCPKCGQALHETNTYCQNCGTPQFEVDKVENDKEIKHIIPWMIVSLIIPFIGIVGGIYYALKGKDHAIWLVALGLLSWFIWWLIDIALMG